MRDFHEHPARSWSDFLKHLGTICLGLLIALSLQQTVEYFHHRHQRLELEAGLRDEADRNLKTVHAAAYLSEEAAVELHWIRLLRDAPVVDGEVTVALTPHLPEGAFHELSRAAWTAGKADGTIALLSHDQNVVYASVDELIGQTKADMAVQITRTTDAFISTTVRKGWLDDSLYEPHTLTLAERDELARLVSDDMSATSRYMSDLVRVAGASNAVLNNVTSLDELQRNEDIPETSVFPYPSRSH